MSYFVKLKLLLFLLLTFVLVLTVLKSYKFISAVNAVFSLLTDRL